MPFEKSQIFQWHEANLNIYSMMFQPGDRAVGNLFQAALGKDGNDSSRGSGWLRMWKEAVADCSSRSRVVCSELILLSAWIRAINAFKNRVRAEWLDHCRGLVRSCSFQFHPIPLDRNQKLQMATSNCFHLRQMWNQKFLQASLPLPTSPKSVVSAEGSCWIIVRFNTVYMEEGSRWLPTGDFQKGCP